jgi:ADP-dependent phosphofructokinase/glucokinase
MLNRGIMIKMEDVEKLEKAKELIAECLEKAILSGFRPIEESYPMSTVWINTAYEAIESAVKQAKMEISEKTK